MPLFAKDDFKELLYDSIGAEDREASRKLGLACYSLLSHTAKIMLASGQSLIIESNFNAGGFGPWIQKFEERYSPVTVQVLLRAEPETILSRYLERSERRHPAHFDDVAVEEMRPQLLDPYEPLDVTGVTLEFDTTDFSKFESAQAIEQVAALLPARANA